MLEERDEILWRLEGEGRTFWEDEGRGGGEAEGVMSGGRVGGLESMLSLLGGVSKHQFMMMAAYVCLLSHYVAPISFTLIRIIFKLSIRLESLFNEFRILFSHSFYLIALSSWLPSFAGISFQCFAQGIPTPSTD